MVARWTSTALQNPVIQRLRVRAPPEMLFAILFCLGDELGVGECD
jgi:hypothetical protein